LRTQYPKTVAPEARHRQLFASSVDALKQEIQRITGVQVREVAAEIDTNTGAVVHAFTSGTMVQVFLMAQAMAADNWTKSDDEKAREGKS
jgi:hypothetical protein